MPTYKADLSEADYLRFREWDQTLPATYAEWRRWADEMVAAGRRRGLDLVLYPISFDAFVKRNALLNIQSTEKSARDDYADEQVNAAVVAAQAQRP